jgi:hypothetical protein
MVWFSRKIFICSVAILVLFVAPYPGGVTGIQPTELSLGTKEERLEIYCRW